MWGDIRRRTSSWAPGVVLGAGPLLKALGAGLFYLGPTMGEGKAETEASWRLLCMMDYDV